MTADWLRVRTFQIQVLANPTLRIVVAAKYAESGEKKR
jgi:hypothetical protein